MNDDRTFISVNCPFKFCNSYIHKKTKGCKTSQMDVNEWCTSALFFDSVSFNPCIAFTLRVKSNAPIPHLKMNETKRKMTTIAESWLRQGAKRISTACQLSIHGSLTSALWEAILQFLDETIRQNWVMGRFWENWLISKCKIPAGYEYGLGGCAGARLAMETCRLARAWHSDTGAELFIVKLGTAIIIRHQTQNMKTLLYCQIELSHYYINYYHKSKQITENVQQLSTEREPNKHR